MKTPLVSMQAMPAAQGSDIVLNGTASNLSRYAHAVNYAQLLSRHRVLYLGEYHSDLGAKHDLIRSMPQLRALGVTHFGIEMFFGDAETQAKLDAFYERPTEENYIPLGRALRSYGDRFASTPDYERMVIAAVRNGIRIFGIDDHPFDRGLANSAWALKVAEILDADLKARVIVYGGTLHMGYHPFVSRTVGTDRDPVNRLLAARGVSGATVSYTGGTYLDDRETRDHSITRAVVANGMGSRRFMLALENPGQGEFEAMGPTHAWPDVVIHTPIHESPIISGQRGLSVQRRENIGRLGLPDDAFWERRWKQFLG